MVEDGDFFWEFHVGFTLAAINKNHFGMVLPPIKMVIFGDGLLPSSK